MPELNCNETSQFEPIKVTLGDEAYVVPEVTEDMLSEVDKIAKEEDSGMSTPRRLLAVMLGVDAEALKKYDSRHVSFACRFVQTAIIEQSGGSVAKKSDAAASE